MVLRQAVSGLVPDWVLHRPKQGFGAPVHDWLGLRFGELLRELTADGELTPTSTAPRPLDLIDREPAAAWPVLNFALWHRYWIEGGSLEEPIARAAAGVAA